MAGGSTPQAPDTSYSVSNGKIHFNFSSTGGFRYVLERFTNIRTGWVKIYDQGWNWRTRSIPKDTTVDPNGNCYAYRVKAANPSGGGSYSQYHNGGAVCT